MFTPRPHQFEKTALLITRGIGSPLSVVIHTILFIICFMIGFAGVVPFDEMLLVLTTIVSLEAIYLSLFIQMSVNMANQSIDEVEQDIDEIQKDVDEIQKDVDEIQEDVDDIQENVDEMNEEEAAEEKQKEEYAKTMSDIYKDMQRLMADIKHLEQNKK